MILLDTSVLIDCLRAKDAALSARFTSLNAAICGITRAEIFCGARDPAHRIVLTNALAALSHIAISESLWDEVGTALCDLRRAGVTVPFTDAAIATVAISNGLELWTRDRQFELIQQAIPQLVLFDESSP